MRCNGPLHGWYSKDRTAEGRRRFTLRFHEAYHDRPLDVPCGRCRGCLLERARQWAVRCVHEASLWPENVFATLTYSPESLPVVGPRRLPTLRPDDFVNFMKRLRHVRDGVRFLQAGEYGALGRPHHHVLLFNCGFSDKEVLSVRRGEPVYRSAVLEDLWPFGHSSFGSVTFESAGYTARYTLKKVCGASGRADDSVSVRRLSWAECQELGVPYQEYMTMSRRPGIGAGWFEKFGSDVFPSDELIVRGGHRMRPPRFYEERFGAVAPGALQEVKRKRVRYGGALPADEKSDRRGADREELTRRRVADFLKREL